MPLDPAARQACPAGGAADDRGRERFDATLRRALES